MRLLLPLLLLLLLRAAPAASQHTFTCGNLQYLQDFDGLTPTTNAACAGPNLPWTDNTTLVGWHAPALNGSTFRYIADNGGCATGSLVNYGPNGGPLQTDRALGNLNSGSSEMAFGVRFVNNTQMTVRSIVVNYTGEQWRRGTNATNTPDRLDFQYKIGPAGSINISDAPAAAGWVNVDPLDFSSPYTNTEPAGLAIDGTAAPNRTPIFHSITGIAVPQGQEIWFRWVFVDITGEDDGLAIDDLAVIIDRDEQFGVCGVTPASPTICPGEVPPLLTLACTEALPPVIAWERSTDAGFAPSTLANTTSATYQHGAAITTTTFFRPVFRVAGGCPVFRLTGVEAAVNVNAAVQPGTLSGASTICTGDNPATQLTLSGYVGNIIRWESSTDNFTSNTTIAHTNDTFLPPGPLTQTTCFRSVVQGGGGCPPAASPSVCITVNALSAAKTLATQPAGAATTICNNTAAPNLILSGGNGLILRWESSTDNFASATTIANTNINYSPGVLTQSTCYRGVSQNAPCAEVNSNEICVSVLPVAAGGTVTAAQTICSGSIPAALTLNGQTGNVLRWESSTDNFVTPALTTVINQTTATLAPNALTQTIFYRAVVAPDPSCPSANSNSVEITVSSPTVAGAVSGASTVCSGSAPTVPLDLAGGTGNVVRWESSVDNFVTTTVAITTATNVSYTPGALTQRTCFRAIQKNGACQERATNAVCIDVDAPSNGGTIFGGGTTVCDNLNAPQLVLTGHVGSIQFWESSTDNFATSTNLPVTTPDIDPGVVAVQTCFHASVKNGACPAVFSTPSCFDPIVCVDAQLATVSAPLVDICTAPQTIGLTGVDTRFLSHTNVHLSRVPDALVPVASGFLSNATTDLDMTFELPATAPVGVWWVIVENGGDQQTVNIPFPLPLQIEITGPNGISGGEVSGAATVCSGNNSGTLTLSGHGGPVVRWESSENNFRDVTTIDNLTDTHSYSDLYETTWFRAVVDGGGCEVYSVPVRITRSQDAYGGRVFSNQQACGNSTAGGLLLLGQQGSILRWESSIDSFAVDLKNIANTNFIQSYNTRQTIWYRAIVAGGSCVTRSRPARVKLDSLPVGGFVGPDMSVCSSQASGLLRIQNFSGDIERWESSTDGFATVTPIAITDAEYNFADLTVDTEFRVVLSRGGACQAFSKAGKVTVVPEPVGGTIAAAATVCGTPNGGTLQLNGYTGNIVRWESSIDTFRTAGQNINVQLDQLDYVDLTQTTCYRALVSAGPACPDVYSDTVCVEFRSADFTGKPFPLNQMVCATDLTAPIELQGATGTIIRWESYEDCENFTNPTPIAETSAILNVTTPDTTTCYRAVVEDAICGTLFSEAAFVRVSNIRFNPEITEVDECINLGSVRANAYGGLNRFYLYEIDPPVMPLNINGYFFNLKPGSYTLRAIDPTIRCTVSTVIDIPPTEDTLRITDIVNLTTTTADLFWNNIGPPGVPTYSLRYRVAGSTEWTTVFNIRSQPRRVLGLQPGTEYEVQLSYTCPNGITTDWTGDTTFTTVSDGDCSTSPIGTTGGMYVDQITPFTATVHYNRVPGAVGYLVQVGLASLTPSSWPTYVVCDPTDSLIVKGLVPGRAYRVRIRAHCRACNSAGGTGMGPNSQIIQFATPLFREGVETAPEVPAAAASRLSVYPNPSQGLLTLSFDAENAGTHLLRVLDLAGREVESLSIAVEAGGNETPLDLTALPAGVYLLRLEGEGAALQTKLILR